MSLGHSRRGTTCLFAILDSLIRVSIANLTSFGPNIPQSCTSSASFSILSITSGGRESSRGGRLCLAFRWLLADNARRLQRLRALSYKYGATGEVIFVKICIATRSQHKIPSELRHFGLIRLSKLVVCCRRVESGQNKSVDCPMVVVFDV